jgi:AcrR family transcriptional regulator
MGKRADQKEQRKRDLLAVSLALFVRKGYDGTAVRDIAAEAGISAGLLFHYFPTKEDILRELLSQARSGVLEMVDRLELAADPLEGFRDIARFILLSFTEASTVELFLLVHQVKTFKLAPGLDSGVLDTAGMIERSLAAIERGQAAGLFKKENPRALSLAFWGALQGIAELLSWYPGYPIPSYESIVDILRA